MDGCNPYVYAQPVADVVEIKRRAEELAEVHPQKYAMVIKVISKDNYYWPLPWYLRKYSRVGYFGHMTPTTEPIIIASEEQRDEMESTFGGLYRQVPSTEPGGIFPLRPGVNLLLYTKRNLSPALAPSPTFDSHYEN